MSSSEPKKRSDVTYVMVLAIFGFRKKARSGRKQVSFLFRFGLHRKSFWCYVRKHLGGFEGPKNERFFTFSITSILDIFGSDQAKWA